MAEKDTRTIREKMDALAAELPSKIERPIEDTETIIGTRRIRGVFHIWLLDSRTATARRLEYPSEFLPPAHLDTIVTAQNEILAYLREWENGV
jgi:hypothetical protein